MMIDSCHTQVVCLTTEGIVYIPERFVRGRGTTSSS